MFEKFTKQGPKLKPVTSESWWRDTRPAPHAHTHGVYHPVLDAREPRMPEHGISIDPPSTKKPRGTV